MENNKHKCNFFYVLLVFSVIGYIWLGYFTSRTDFYQLISLFGFLFIAYYYLIRLAKNESRIKTAVSFSLIARIALLFMLPNLSDDYFRFAWDGRLFANGLNPYITLPDAFFHTKQAAPSWFTTELFNGLNSKNYYSVYPPVLQFIFALSVKFFPDNLFGSILIMRIIIVLAEAGTIYLIRKFLVLLGLPQKNILLYALNPLVIIELTGNLHFEAVMIFFLLAAIWFIMMNKLLQSAILFALAIATKLIPMMFLPLLIKRIGWRKTGIYFLVVGIVLAALLFPFIDKQVSADYSSGIYLFFQKFEFNASVYYLVRWAGNKFTGYNIIQTAGPVLAAVAILIILLVTILDKNAEWKNFFQLMLFCLGIYYLFATTVHPWYITTLVLLGLFSPYRFSLVWSAFVFLTYYTYITADYKESLWLVAIEYIVVILFLIQEAAKIRKESANGLINCYIFLRGYFYGRKE